MLIRDERPGGFWLGMALLAIGFVVGALLSPLERFSLGGPVETDPVPALQPSGGPDSVGPNSSAEDPVANEVVDLPQLALEISPDSMRVLEEVRDRALERGVILQEPSDTVPATVSWEGARYPAEVRIKGDWVDHVETDKWSLRVRLKEGRLLGMRAFSIQSPHTRGQLWEWLVLEAGRREGLLAPRASFVDVQINGQRAGVYYLEEHFGKELLESQGRREGPIVVFDEDTHWEMLVHQTRIAPTGVRLPRSETLAGAHRLGAAGTRAYGEKRLSSIDSLARALNAALAKLRLLREEVVAAEADPTRLLRTLEAMRATAGTSVERLLDVERLAQMHALFSLFQIQHSLTWHNLRFYHDPLLDRLEPILFDNMAHLASAPDPVPQRVFGDEQGIAAFFAESERYVNGVFRNLPRFADPLWLDELFLELEPELRRFERALQSEEPLGPSFTVEGMKQRLRAQQLFLGKVLYPDDAANFAAFYEVHGEGESEADGVVTGELTVEAWATTATPVVVEGFRFSNGSQAAAADLVESEMSMPSSEDLLGGVVLPHDGRAVRFRFPMNTRLANLETIEELKRALKTRSTAGKLDLAIDVLFRPLASPAARSERLVFRRFEPAWRQEQGRPPAPSVAQALELHRFLDFDPSSGALVARAGRWEVQGDLVLPSGVELHAGPGVELLFEPQAVLCTDAALRFEGTRAQPVVLGPRPGAEVWSGVVVLGAQERSSWSYVLVRATDAVVRGGWQTTGGVTFYRSAVDLSDCRIEGTRAEDGLNVFAADLRVERVTFSGCVSDSFDGDFVTGVVASCTFENGLADGVDFSGSRVELRDCRFEHLADKAISAGENTELLVVGGVANDVSIGVAAKDASRVEVRGLSIADAKNYALAAFIKKPEFGPSTLVAEQVDVRASGRGDALCQIGCSLTWNGRTVEGRKLDVARLYSEGVLGK